MAITGNLNFNLNLVLPVARHMACPPRVPSFLFTRGRGAWSPSLLVTRAIDANEFLGDFGARDPFPAELESSFGEKVLGYGNTEHKILIPTITALGLSQQECAPVSSAQPPISLDDAQTLIRKAVAGFEPMTNKSPRHNFTAASGLALKLKVVGWRLVNEENGLKIQCLWKLRDFKCGVELINRISKVVEAEGHFPNIYLEQPNQVRAELWTASIGGLSMNDFIVAAKIDQIKTSDLVPRKRVWA
ncbi:hypothetical protein JHK86_027942 [Glycine max]|nr:hypothetical protein JHK86_027942 [Glycine max]